MVRCEPMTDEPVCLDCGKLCRRLVDEYFLRACLFRFSCDCDSQGCGVRGVRWRGGLYQIITLQDAS